MRIFLVLLLIIHGLIHFMGFAKAFGYGHIAQLTKEISRPFGMVWLLAALLFFLTALLFLLKKDSWWIDGLVAVIVSQALILSAWQDAKFGTIPNMIILAVVVLSFGSIRFEHGFQRDVKENLLRSNAQSMEILTEADLKHLPEPVQRYLRYVGVLNKPKVKNVRIVFEGKMRDKGKDWFPFRTLQYNFFDEPTRLFFMKARMFGVMVPGYHKYSSATATMDIRLFGLFPVIRQAGDIMNKTETVTLFNDMCLMAPASLIDKRIQWQAIDDGSAKATFTNHGISISAILYINKQGQLTDFLSNDRTAMPDMKPVPFTTPVSDYKEVNGNHVMGHGDAVWHYPDGEFTYGKFVLKEIDYNVSEFQQN